MRNFTAAPQSSRAGALARTKTSFYAASALLLAAAMAGCSGPLDEADVAGAEPEEGQDQGKLETAQDGATATLADTSSALAGKTPAPTLACAPLCNGSCTPIQLATGINTNGAIYLALTDQYVYFGGGYGSEVSDDEVGRVPKAGGTKTILLDQLTYVTDVVGSGANAYFVGSKSGLGSNLNKVSPAGTITPVPITGGYPSGVAVNSTHIYWIGNNQYKVYAMPLSGGAPSVVVPGSVGLRTSLFEDGDSLYYREIGSLYGVFKAPKSGAAAPTQFLTGTSIWFLAFDRTDAYFVRNAIYRVPKSGGTPVQLATGEARVVVDNERLYWFDGSALRAMCKDGTGSQVLAATSSSFTLAVDSTGVYWAADGKIWKVAK